MLGSLCDMSAVLCMTASRLILRVLSLLLVGVRLKLMLRRLRRHHQSILFHPLTTKGSVSSRRQGHHAQSWEIGAKAYLQHSHRPRASRFQSEELIV